MIIADFDLNGERQIVELEPIAYSGGGTYHVYINRFFITSISKMKDGWTVHFNNNSWLTMDEADILIEMIKTGEVIK